MPKVTTFDYPCDGDCGTLLSRPNTRCFACRRKRRTMIAAKAETNIRSARIKRSISQGTTYGIMYLGGEPVTLAWRCIVPACQKPMLVQGRCYQCATGRERTLQARVIARDELLQTA